MAAVAVSLKFEQDKLQAAINERIKVQGRTVRTFAQIVNTALFYVAAKAQKYTPKATPEKIRASAYVQIHYVVNTRTGVLVPGKAGRKGKKGNKFDYFPSSSPSSHGEQVTFAMMFAVVLARANLSRQGRQSGQSYYNARTADAWKLDKSILKTRDIIWNIAERMISARSSSGAMLKAGWKPAIDILGDKKAQSDGRQISVESFERNSNLDRLGTAVPAKEGWRCWGMIENHVGHGGTPLDANQQKALLEYGSEPLARALSEEADEMMAKIAEYLERDARAFNQSMR